MDINFSSIREGGGEESATLMTCKDDILGMVQICAQLLSIMGSETLVQDHLVSERKLVSVVRNRIYSRRQRQWLQYSQYLDGRNL